MSQVSGCRVTGVLGDQAVVTGVLDCGDRPAGWALPAAALNFDCLETDQWVNEGPGPDYQNFECSAF
ncbi:hypothetical protein [Primorskyibacter sp. S87]|uniref:hypothetical protein n=1 Tax=Primorskyibacter sp. S87 TaxID=3415126 RepID=UPI003C7AB8BB